MWGTVDALGSVGVEGKVILERNNEQLVGFGWAGI